MPSAILTPFNSTKTRNSQGKDGRLVFRKQVLPVRKIDYKARDGSHREIDFSSDYLDGMIKAFNDGSASPVNFTLADSQNRHTADPERVRGSVYKLSREHKGEEPGLYAEMSFTSREAATSILNNPGLGVSARIEENRSQDGKTYPASIVHVCGTLDPQIRGLGPWEQVDFTASDDQDIVDLTEEEWPMGKKSESNAGADGSAGTALKDRSEDGDDLTEEEINKALESALGNLSDNDGGDNSSGASSPSASLSQEAQDQIDLANSRAEVALRMAADANWEKESSELIASGIPKALVDLAEPFLHRADPYVIDLSNGETEDAGARVRKMLSSMKDYIDLSGIPRGEDATSEEQARKSADQEVLGLWEKEFPVNG